LSATVAVRVGDVELDPLHPATQTISSKADTAARHFRM